MNVLIGHTGYVCSMAYSPNGKNIASGSRDYTVRVWDVETSQCTLILSGHTDTVYSVAYSLDGKNIVSGGKDHSVRVWNASKISAEPGQSVWVLRGHSNDVTSVAYSPDGKHMASASYDRSVRVWDMGTGKCVSILRGHVDHVFTLSYSPNGKNIASGSHDNWPKFYLGGNTIRIWDTVTRQYTETLCGHAGISVYSVAYSPDGKNIASAHDDGKVRVWDASTGQCVWISVNYPWYVAKVAYSPDGNYVIGIDGTGFMHILDFSTGNSVWSRQFPVYSNLIESVGRQTPTVFYVKNNNIHCEQILFFSALTILTGLLSAKGGNRLNDPRIYANIRRFLG